jgi:hypothetical protein
MQEEMRGSRTRRSGPNNLGYRNYGLRLLLPVRICLWLSPPNTFWTAVLRKKLDDGFVPENMNAQENTTTRRGLGNNQLERVNDDDSV